MALVVLAMTISAITVPFVAAAQNDEVGARLAVATGAAEALMEEILSRPAIDPDGMPEPPGAPRADFDNIMDYDQMIESEGKLCSANGDLLSEPLASGLSRQVSVEPIFLPGQDINEPPTVLRIVVSVADKGVRIVTLSRLVTADDS